MWFTVNRSDLKKTETPSGRLPNFLYIGTSKAGSTWIYNMLAAHPDIFIVAGKGSYFFDQHFDLGMDWYREQFSRAAQKAVVGEISHSYLSSPLAAQRIAEWLPSVKLLVCLREPVDRAFSAYLDSVKNGRFDGSFEEALEENASLLQRGAYAEHLQRYLDLFPREQLCVSIFDDLKSRPQDFADQIFDFLSVERRQLGPEDTKKMMPAAVPRSRWLTQSVKRAARAADRIGLRRLRGRIKRSRTIRNLLYRPMRGDEKPQMSPETRDRCRNHFRADVEKLDALFGLSLQERWNYR